MSLLSSEQATYQGDIAHTTLLRSTFLLVASKETTKSKATEELVDAQTTKQTIDKTAKTKTI